MGGHIPHNQVMSSLSPISNGGWGRGKTGWGADPVAPSDYGSGGLEQLGAREVFERKWKESWCREEEVQSCEFDHYPGRN